MTSEKLLEYIAKNQDQYIFNVLNKWLTSNKRFRELVYRFPNTIQKKLFDKRGQILWPDTLADNMAELEIAYRLLFENRMDVIEYRDPDKGGPDFFVGFQESKGEKKIEFNLEVTRIQESVLGRKFDQWLNDIIREVRCLPSGIGFSIEIIPQNRGPETLKKLVDRLQRSTAGITESIKRTIMAEKDQLPHNTPVRYQVLGTEETMELILERPACKDSIEKTYFYGLDRPVFYTKKEHEKFKDEIDEKLHQLCPNQINVIVIRSASTTHEGDDLDCAVEALKEGDLLRSKKDLSGIIFISSWRGQDGHQVKLWCNESAENQIPVKLGEALVSVCARSE